MKIVKIVHEIRGVTTSDFIVVYNPNKKYIVREYTRDGEFHKNTLDMYFDGVSGEKLISCYLPCIYPDKTKFLIGLSQNKKDRFIKWDNNRIMLIPFNNVKVHETSDDLRFNFNRLIREWKDNRETWWKEWHDGVIEKKLMDYINKVDLELSHLQNLAYKLSGMSVDTVVEAAIDCIENHIDVCSSDVVYEFIHEENDKPNGNTIDFTFNQMESMVKSSVSNRLKLVLEELHKASSLY